jgi:tetratricopeptide (TPR) repeat protein
VVGEKHLDIAEINYSIGHVLQQKKKHDEAKERFLTAMAITEDLVGEYHHICSSAQRGLGEIHFEKEEYERALECFQKSSTIMDALLSGTVEESTMSHITASENDNSDRSLKLRLDALEAGPRDNLDSAITKYNIHMALMKIGRPDQHEEADKNLEEALQVFTNVLGVEHSWTQTASRGTGEPLPSSIAAAETNGTGG